MCSDTVEPWLQDVVLRQLGAVLRVQEWRCASLDVLAKATAATVSIEAYLICKSLVEWMQGGILGPVPFALNQVSAHHLFVSPPLQLACNLLLCAGLPLLFLLGYEDEACLLASALALTTHVTCALKDLLCGPRPAHACQSSLLNSQTQESVRSSKPVIKVRSFIIC